MLRDPSSLPRFKHLAKLAKVLLLIPHSNSYCESVFSTIRKICTDGRHNLGKDAAKGHASTSVYKDTTTIRNNLIGILITKINIFGRRKIQCYEWEPPKQVITHAKSVTYTTLKARRDAANRDLKIYDGCPRRRQPEITLSCFSIIRMRMVKMPAVLIPSKT